MARSRRRHIECKLDRLSLIEVSVATLDESHRLFRLLYCFVVVLNAIVDVLFFLGFAVFFH